MSQSDYLSYDNDDEYKNSLQNLSSSTDWILDADAVDPYIKKMINATRSAEEKKEIVKERTLQKQLDITGYQKDELFFDDPDSGYFLNKQTGEKTYVRLADLNPYDAIDSEKARNASQSKAKLQPFQVASIVGKSEDQLTEADFQNVKNYQMNQIYGQFTDPNFESKSYDRNTIYENTGPKSATVAFKTTGTDAYGRHLIEAINPSNGKQVSFDAGNDPYLNSHFDVYKSIDSAPNRERLRKYYEENNQNKVNIADLYDQDGRISESLDMIKSAGYKSAARLLQYGPDFLLNTEKWRKVASEKTGQQLADAWAGVKIDTREAYSNEMQKASDDWNEGNYVKAIIGFTSQMDRLIADSATQMGLMAAGTLVSGGLLGTATIGARIGSMLIGSMPAALDVTLGMNEQYKENNNGENMSGEDFARHFAVNIALLVPEALLMGVHFNKYLPKQIGSKFDKIFELKAVPSRLKLTGVSAFEEFVQEAAQESYETYGSQSQNSSKQSYFNILFSSEGVKSGTIGALMGGAMSGGTALATLPFAKAAESKRAAIIEQNIKKYKEQTETGSDANIEFSNNTIAKVSEFTKPSDIITLTKMATHPELNNEAKDAILQQRNNLLIKLAKEDESKLEEYGTNKEDVFKEFVLHSDPNGRLTNTKEVGKSLGLSDDFIEKTISMNDVNEDIRYSSRGYETYGRNLTDIREKLKDASLSEEEKTKLQREETLNVAKINNLIENQSTKLGSIASAIADINSGYVRNKIARFRSGGYFKVKSSDIVRGSFETGNSVFGMINNITEDLGRMYDILSNSDVTTETDAKKNIDSVLANIKANIANIQQKGLSSKIVEKTVSKDFSKVTDSTKPLTNTDIIGNIKTLERISNIKNEKNQSIAITAFKVSRSNGQLQQLKSYLESNPNINASKILNEIVSSKIEMETTLEKERNSRQEIVDKANEAKNKYTDEAINKLETFDDVKEFSKEFTDIKRSLNTLNSADESVKELSKFYNEVATKLRNKVSEINKNEIQKVIDDKEHIDIKYSDYAIHSIFNNKFNKPSSDFNLKDELKVGEPKSLIGKKIIETTKKYADNVLIKINDIIPRIFSLAYLNAVKDGSSMLTSAPQLRVLFDLKLDENGNPIKEVRDQKESIFKINDNVAMAIDFSLREHFSSINIGKEFNPYDKRDMAKTYGLNETDLTRRQKQQIRELSENYGIPRALMSERIGKLILQNLGIEKAKGDNATVGYYERVATGLGTFALRYAEQQGWINQNKFIVEDWKKENNGRQHFLESSKIDLTENGIDINELTDVNTDLSGELDSNLDMTIERGKEIAFIQVNSDKLLQATKEYKDTLKDFKTEENESTKPTPKFVDFNPDTKVKNTNNLMNMTSYTKKIFNKLFKTPNTLNTELVEKLIKDRDLIEKQLGVLTDDEIKELIPDDQITAKGQREAIKREIDDIIEMYNQQKELNNKHWFFRWFFSRGGRNYIDSAGVNPQSGKAIQRFLILPEKVKRTLSLDPNMSIEEYYNTKDFAITAFAIAQAFDVVKSDDKIMDIAKKLINIPANEIYEVLTKEGKEGLKAKYEIGLENFSHALNVIQHIEKFQQARAEGKTSFETWLAIENDSTTSGYFIKLLQFPENTIINNFGSKVGILPEGYEHGWTEIHSLKDTEGFLDIYKTIASKAKIPEPRLIEIRTQPSNKDTKSLTIEETLSVKKQKMWVDGLDTKNEVITYNIMFDALPKSDVDEKGQVKVSSKLRKLFKNPTMIFGYTAGKESITKALSEEISIEFIRDYVKHKNGKETDIDSKILNKLFSHLEQFNTTVDNKIDNNKLTLLEAFKTKTLSNIWLKIDGRSITIDEYFNSILAPTYGEAVWKALQKSFKPFKKYNDSMNYMFKSMFTVFNKKLEQEMNILKDKYPNGIPIIKEQELIDSLFNLMPVIRLAINNIDETLKEGMLLMNTQKQYNTTTKVQSYYQNNKTGKAVSDMGYATVKKFIDAGQAGAVLPIHFIDGMGMSMILDKYGDSIIPVHDAIVMSAFDNQELTQAYNRDMFTLCKEFDVFGTLVDRFNEVMNLAQEMKLIKPTDFITTGFKPTEYTPTISEFLNGVNNLKAINKQNRDSFYSSDNKYYITNMDGIKGSGYTVNGSEAFAENQFISAWTKDKSLMKERVGTLYSDPKTFTPSGKIIELARGGLENVKTRLEIFDRLQAMDSNPEKEQHLSYLKSLISKVNPTYIMGLIVGTTEHVNNAANITRSGDLTIGLDNKTDVDTVSGKHPYTTKSGAELYAHELVHAGLRFGFENFEALGFKKEIHQIMQIMKQVIETDLITWEDFMPDGNYDITLQEVYEENAKDQYRYIFNNDNRKNLVGLHEFMAYGLTNEKIMNKLKSQYIRNIDPSKKATLLDRVISLGMTILNVARGKGKFSEIFKTGYEVLKGNYSLKQKDTLYASLLELHNKVNQSNQKAINTLWEHPARALEHTFKFFGDLIKQGNKWIRPYTTYIANIADERGWAKDFSIPIHGSFFEYAKLYTNIALLTPFSKSRKQALTTILSKSANISQQGVLASILRDLQEPDKMTSTLEEIAAYTRMLERDSKSIESIIKLNLRENFNPDGHPDNDLTDLHKKAITKTMLYTDLSSLVKLDENEQVSNVDEIIDYLKNPNKIADEISFLKDELNKTNYGIYYINQAKFLSRFMVEGIGVENLNLNAKNIAEGRGTGIIFDTTESTIQKIDRLVTLYALNRTSEIDRNLVSSLNKDGLANYLKVQHNFIKESTDEKITDPIHMIKGYSKSMFDTSLDTKIGRLEDKIEMKKAGYKLIKKIGKNEITDQSDLALYQRSWSVARRRDGSAFVLTGANTIGTALWESAYSLQSQMTPDNVSMSDVSALADTFKSRAQALSTKFNNLMMNKELSEQYVDNISKGYTPVASPNGGYSDFRITMSTADKVKYMGMSQDGFSILSKMYASKNTKMNASSKNEFIIQFLENDMKENMIAQTKLNKEGKNYIKLDRNSENKFLRDAYNVIPKELRDIIKKYDRDGEGFWVREEWLQQLFGVPTTSLIDNPTINKYTNNLAKHAITLAEYIMKHIAYFAKQNIVIRYPAVLIGNIMSNINLSVANGTNPAVVIKKQIENAQNIRDYVDNQKTLNKILFKQKIKSATEKEINTINWYKAKLEYNPVHVLMEKGMYQSIVEDLDITEMDNVGKINKWIGAVTNNKRVPKSVKSIVKHMYMMEGTPLFDLMFQATQYSDFVARATEYQLQMDKAPFKYLVNPTTKEQRINPKYKEYEQTVITNVWNAFINYNKPQSSKEQYLNDLGLMMFTKFTKRIQHVIFKNLTENPLSSALFLMSQSLIADTSDIFEDMLGMKDLTYKFFSPFTNFMNAATPIPIQYATGTGLFGR